jgi:hypothetical protein
VPKPKTGAAPAAGSAAGIPNPKTGAGAAAGEAAGDAALSGDANLVSSAACADDEQAQGEQHVSTFREIRSCQMVFSKGVRVGAVQPPDFAMGAHECWRGGITGETALDQGILRERGRTHRNSGRGVVAHGVSAVERGAAWVGMRATAWMPCCCRLRAQRSCRGLGFRG